MQAQKNEEQKFLYRMGVGIMLINENKHIFTARRIDTRAEAWQMPQGGIDKGEEPHQAAFRELKEEIGTNNVEIMVESRDWLYYDLPKSLANKLWGGKYKGQKQKWFLMKFLGSDAEINIATKHPEFSEWKWTHPEKVIDLIVPFKRELYRQVIKEFLPYL